MPRVFHKISSQSLSVRCIQVESVLDSLTVQRSIMSEIHCDKSFSKWFVKLYLAPGHAFIFIITVIIISD